MLSRKNIIDILIVAMTLTAVVIGMCAVRQVGYQAGFTTAKTLVEQSPLGAIMRTPIQTADDVRTLFGTVTVIDGTSITLRTVSVNPFDNPSLNDRIILVASSTKILRFTPKDPTIFQNELTAYTKTIQSGSAAKNPQPPIPPPAPVTQTTITLADIKIGDVLMVTAFTNIKSVKEFTASDITIQPPLAPATNPQPPTGI